MAPIKQIKLSQEAGKLIRYGTGSKKAISKIGINRKAAFAKRVARAQETAIECKRVGLAVMGLEVPHAHIHLIPITKESDMYFGGKKLAVSQEELAEIAAKIRKEFK